MLSYGYSSFMIGNNLITVHSSERVNPDILVQIMQNFTLQLLLLRIIA